MFLRISKLIVTVLAALALGVYLLIWLLSPTIIKSQAAPLLEDLDFRLSESAHIRFNPFTFVLSLEDAGLESLDRSERYLTIQAGRIDLDAFALLDKVLRFEDITLSDSSLSISRDQENLKIAGFPITGDSEETPNDETGSSKASDLNWRIEVQSLSIQQLSGTVNDNGTEHLARLKQLNLQDVVLGLRDQKGELKLDAQLNDALFSSQVQFSLSRQTGEINVRFELKDFNPGSLVYLSDGALSEASASITLALESQIHLEQKGLRVEWQDFLLQVEALNARSDADNYAIQELKLEIPDGKVAIDQDDLAKYRLQSHSIHLQASGLKAQRQGLDLQVPELSLKVPANTIAIKNNQLSELNTDLAFQFAQLTLVNSANEDLLLSAESLTVDPLQISLNENKQPELSAPLIALNQLTLSQAHPAEDALPALFSSEGIAFKGLQLNANAAHLEQLALKPFRSALFIAKDKSIRNLVMPNIPDNDNALTESTTPENSALLQPETQNPDAERFAFSLGEFVLQGESELVIRDNSVQPAFQETFYLTKAEVGALDTSDNTLYTPFSAAFKAGTYAQGKSQGEIALFSDKVNLAMEASITEFPLPKISPYVREAANMDMLSGQFDNILNLKITDNDIKGQSQLNLRGLEVETAGDVKKGDLSEHSFIPLSLALGALKDSDGNIEMEVPLSGNVNDPDFGMKGFIYLISQKAALAAAESYVINTFVPYANIVSLTRMAGEYALKVRIEDMLYEAGQIAPDEAQQSFIDGFVALLEQKPDLQVKACPFATLADIDNGNADINNPNVIEQLQSIARQRGERFKETIVNQSGIASSRVLLCQEKIDGHEEGTPRIEFNI